MNSAVLSTPATSEPVYSGLAQRLGVGGRSLLQRRGSGDLAGVLSGSAFVLARVPVYLAVLSFAAATCVAGVLLYLVRAVVRLIAGGTQELQIVSQPDLQRSAIGGRHG